MSSRKTVSRRGTTKKRAQRATSNVFAMFDQAQIAEFKEAFNMIDQNHDGFVDKEDLHDMLASLGETENIWHSLFYPYNLGIFLTICQFQKFNISSIMPLLITLYQYILVLYLNSQMYINHYKFKQKNVKN